MDVEDVVLLLLALPGETCKSSSYMIQNESILSYWCFIFNPLAIASHCVDLLS